MMAQPDFEGITYMQECEQYWRDGACFNPPRQPLRKPPPPALANPWAEAAAAAAAEEAADAAAAATAAESFWPRVEDMPKAATTALDNFWNQFRPSPLAVNRDVAAASTNYPCCVRLSLEEAFGGDV